MRSSAISKAYELGHMQGFESVPDDFENTKSELGTTFQQQVNNETAPRQPSQMSQFEGPSQVFADTEAMGAGAQEVNEMTVADL